MERGVARHNKSLGVATVRVFQPHWKSEPCSKLGPHAQAPSCGFWKRTAQHLVRFKCLPNGPWTKDIWTKLVSPQRVRGGKVSQVIESGSVKLLRKHEAQTQSPANLLTLRMTACWCPFKAQQKQTHVKGKKPGRASNIPHLGLNHRISL